MTLESFIYESIADIKKMSSKTLLPHEEIIEKKEEEKTEKPIEDVTKEVESLISMSKDVNVVKTN